MPKKAILHIIVFTRPRKHIFRLKPLGYREDKYSVVKINNRLKAKHLVAPLCVLLLIAVVKFIPSKFKMFCCKERIINFCTFEWLTSKCACEHITFMIYFAKPFLKIKYFKTAETDMINDHGRGGNKSPCLHTADEQTPSSD